MARFELANILRRLRFSKPDGLSAGLHSVANRLHLTDYLPHQRAMSPHTLHSYRDSLKLLLQFVAGKRDPGQLTMQQLTQEQVLAFLQHLEAQRHNRVSTRNVRLSAIHCFFRYVGVHHPQHLAQAQRILSIPFKRTALREIEHLEFAEIQSILQNVERSTRDGRRDHVLLGFMFNTGARVSEVVGLTAYCRFQLTTFASVLIETKGVTKRLSDSRYFG